MKRRVNISGTYVLIGLAIAFGALMFLPEKVYSVASKTGGRTYMIEENTGRVLPLPGVYIKWMYSKKGVSDPLIYSIYPEVTEWYQIYQVPPLVFYSDTDGKWGKAEMDCAWPYHIWRALFPPGYSATMKSLYPTIPFREGEDGGGTWVLDNNKLGRFRPLGEYGWPLEDQVLWYRFHTENDKYMNSGFEWIPPACSLSCSLSATPETVSHVNGGKIELKATISGEYDRISWEWTPGHTACSKSDGYPLSIVPDKNDPSRATVTFPQGTVCDGYITAISIDSYGCSASCATVFHITNEPPQVVSITPQSGVSGTEPDDDNDPTCSDNNPQIFEVTVRDSDGSMDIRRVNFWVDASNEPNPATNIDKSIHASVLIDDKGAKSYGMKCNLGMPCTDPISYGWSVYGFMVVEGEPESRILCSAAPNLKFDTRANKNDCRTAVGGISPFGFYRKTASKPIAPDQAGRGATGNEVKISFKVWFDKGADTGIGSDLNVFASVEDTANASSGWQNKADWKLDFTPPSGHMEFARDSSHGPDEVSLNSRASDSTSADSGLYRVYDRIHKVNSSESRDPTQGPLNGAMYWPGPEDKQFSTIVFSGVTGGDTLTASMKISDMACNARTVSASPFEVGEAWIRTLWGLVYGREGFFDPIGIGQDPDEGITNNLSSYWLGTSGTGLKSCSRQVNFKFGTGSGQSPQWCSDGYDDMNRSVNWFTKLKLLADRSDWVETNGYTSEMPDFGDGKSGIYNVEHKNLTVSGTCKGRKVVFVSGIAAITINPDFRLDSAGPDNACLIIADSRVLITITKGSSKGVSDDPPETDVIDIAIITQGDVIVEKDDVAPVFDRLRVNGFIYSNGTVSLKRDLVFADNQQYPAQDIRHDARYLDLLRDMFKEIRYQDFECGVAQGSKRCIGW